MGSRHGSTRHEAQREGKRLRGDPYFIEPKPYCFYTGDIRDIALVWVGSEVVKRA